MEGRDVLYERPLFDSKAAKMYRCIWIVFWILGEKFFRSNFTGRTFSENIGEGSTPVNRELKLWLFLGHSDDQNEVNTLF